MTENIVQCGMFGCQNAAEFNVFSPICTFGWATFKPCHLHVEAAIGVVQQINQLLQCDEQPVVTALEPDFSPAS